MTPGPSFVSPPDMPLLFAEVLGPDADADRLLAAHFDLMRAQSPAESCHVMTATQLRAPKARVFLGRDIGGQAVAVGALKPFGEGAAELKAMHCAQARRGQGVGRALLAHLERVARDSGITSLWLETGASDDFVAARRLYGAAGFTSCPPFGAYRPDPLSVFMTRTL